MGQKAHAKAQDQDAEALKSAQVLLPQSQHGPSDAAEANQG